MACLSFYHITYVIILIYYIVKATTSTFLSKPANRIGICYAAIPLLNYYNNIYLQLF